MHIPHGVYELRIYRLFPYAREWGYRTPRGGVDKIFRYAIPKAREVTRRQPWMKEGRVLVGKKRWHHDGKTHRRHPSLGLSSFPLSRFSGIIPLYRSCSIEGDSRLDHRLEGSSNRARALYSSLKRLKRLESQLSYCASNKVH